MGVIKKKSAHFATQRRFDRGQRSQEGAGICTIFRIYNESYKVQSYFLRLTINHFHCKKDGHGSKECTLYLAIEEKKK